MSETIDDLKTLHAELLERRREIAYQVGSAHHDERIEKLALIQTAIKALDEVILEGKDAPEAETPHITFI